MNLSQILAKAAGTPENDAKLKKLYADNGMTYKPKPVLGRTDQLKQNYAAIGKEYTPTPAMSNDQKLNKLYADSGLKRPAAVTPQQGLAQSYKAQGLTPPAKLTGKAPAPIVISDTEYKPGTGMKAASVVKAYIKLAAARLAKSAAGEDIVNDLVTKFKSSDTLGRAGMGGIGGAALGGLGGLLSYAMSDDPDKSLLKRLAMGALMGGGLGAGAGAFSSQWIDTPQMIAAKAKADELAQKNTETEAALAKSQEDSAALKAQVDAAQIKLAETDAKIKALEASGDVAAAVKLKDMSEKQRQELDSLRTQLEAEKKKGVGDKLGENFDAAGKQLRDSANNAKKKLGEVGQQIGQATGEVVDKSKETAKQYGIMTGMAAAPVAGMSGYLSAKGAPTVKAKTKRGILGALLGVGATGALGGAGYTINNAVQGM